MKTTMKRVAVATALAAPLMISAMGLAAAAPSVTPGGAGAPFDGTVSAPAGEVWSCLVTAPGFGWTVATSVPVPLVTAPPAAAPAGVSGLCVGLPGLFAPLTGSVA